MAHDASASVVATAQRGMLWSILFSAGHAGEIDAYTYARTSSRERFWPRKRWRAATAEFMPSLSRYRVQSFILNSLVVISLVTAAIPSHAQPSGAPIVIGEKFQIHFNVLNESRALLIATPETYDQETDRYPVLYVLDGEDYSELNQALEACRSNSMFNVIDKVTSFKVDFFS